MSLFRVRLRILTISMALIVILTSCSSTRLIYTLAGEFIKEEISYFLDLDEIEEGLLSQQVTEMVAWHRTTMLPIYAAYLTDIADMLAAGRDNADDIARVLADGRSLIEKTVRGLTPRVSEVLVQHMTADDITFMEKRMAARRQQRMAELLKSDASRYEDRLKQMTTNFERFFGELTNGQVNLLESYARATLGDAMIRLRNRTKRQTAFLAFFRTQPTKVALTAYINKLLLRGYEITDPEHEAFSEASLARFRQLLVKMLAVSSLAQRQTIIRNVRSYAEDFKSVSG